LARGQQQQHTHAWRYREFSGVSAVRAACDIMTCTSADRLGAHRLSECIPGVHLVPPYSVYEFPQSSGCRQNLAGSRNQRPQTLAPHR